MTLADIGAAAVAVVLALVPAALLVFALHAAAGAASLDRHLGRRGYAVAVALTGAALLAFGIVATWAAAGANYLKPRCAAFAAPDYAGPDDGRPEPLVTDGIAIDAGSPPPRWARDLVASGGFRFYEWRDAAGHIRRAPDEDAAGIARVELRARRSGTRVSAWLTLGTDRFTLRDRLTGDRLATGAELWIDAGAARYRCGVASGLLPVRSTEYPQPSALLDFVRGAARPADR